MPTNQLFNESMDRAIVASGILIGVWFYDVPRIMFSVWGIRWA